MRRMQLRDITFDYDLYPRAKCDWKRISYFLEVLRYGAKLPPILIDSTFKRCVDGFHRGKAQILEYGNTAKCDVIVKKYKSYGDMFLDSIRINTRNGTGLSTYEQASCILRADMLGIELADLADALCIPIDTVMRIKEHRIGIVKGTETPIVLKKSVLHKKVLTKKQAEINQLLDDTEQSFHLNQIILLLEGKLLDIRDREVWRKVKRLKELLGRIQA